MLRTVNDQPSLWERSCRRSCWCCPPSWRGWTGCWMIRRSSRRSRRIFDPRIGRPSVPMETYLRMMFLKYRYRLGYETLCREVGDSISWQRFCRIPFGTRVPHPTTLMKITTRCGDEAVDRVERGVVGQGRRGEAAAHRQGPRRHHRGGGAVAYPTDSGLLAKAVGSDRRHDHADSGRRRGDRAPGYGTAVARRAAGPLDRGQAASARRCGTTRKARLRYCEIQPGSWPVSRESAILANAQAVLPATPAVPCAPATGQGRRGRWHRRSMT